MADSRFCRPNGRGGESPETRYITERNRFCVFSRLPGRGKPTTVVADDFLNTSEPRINVYFQQYSGMTLTATLTRVPAHWIWLKSPSLSTALARPSPTATPFPTFNTIWIIYTSKSTTNQSVNRGVSNAQLFSYVVKQRYPLTFSNWSAMGRC